MPSSTVVSLNRQFTNDKLTHSLPVLTDHWLVTGWPREWRPKNWVCIQLINDCVVTLASSLTAFTFINANHILMRSILLSLSQLPIHTTIKLTINRTHYGRRRELDYITRYRVTSYLLSQWSAQPESFAFSNRMGFFVTSSVRFIITIAPFIFDFNFRFWFQFRRTDRANFTVAQTLLECETK